MSALPYHKRFHGDALTGFMALTLEERGAYQTLLDLIYDRGGPILDNERLIAGYMGCSVRKWRAIRDELIAKRKIRINRDGLITNDRAEKELENSAKTSRKLSESGSKGGRNRAENEKKPNENNEIEQASPEAGSSAAQAIPEARVQSSDTIVSARDQSESAKRAVFELGVRLLIEDGRSDSAARSLIAKLRQRVTDPELSRLLMIAQGKTDRAAWLRKAVEGTADQRNELYASIDRKYGGQAGATQ